VDCKLSAGSVQHADNVGLSDSFIRNRSVAAHRWHAHFMASRQVNMHVCCCARCVFTVFSSDLSNNSLSQPFSVDTFWYLPPYLIDLSNNCLTNAAISNLWSGGWNSTVLTTYGSCVFCGGFAVWAVDLRSAVERGEGMQ
jgi:hypothetical protein